MFGELFPLLKLNILFRWSFPEADYETWISMQVIYLGDGPKKCNKSRDREENRDIDP